MQNLQKKQRDNSSRTGADTDSLILARVGADVDCSLPQGKTGTRTVMYENSR